LWLDEIARVQWTPGSHVHAVSSVQPVRPGLYIDPSYPRLHGVVHWSSYQIRAPSHT